MLKWFLNVVWTFSSYTLIHFSADNQAGQSFISYLTAKVTLLWSDLLLLLLLGLSFCQFMFMRAETDVKFFGHMNSLFITSFFLEFYVISMYVL